MLIAPREAVQSTLLSLAQYWDLYDDAERSRSAVALRELFYSLCAHLKVAAFIEAGAHEANASRKMLSLAGIERVVALEANPYVYKKYHNELSRLGPKFSYMNNAVGAADGVVSLKLQKEPNFVGEDKYTQGNNSILTRVAVNLDYLDEKIQMMSLDSVYRTLLRPITNLALWVDVEGAAYDVLLGGAQALKHVSIAIAEVEEIGIWANQRLEADVTVLFEQNGFVPVFRDFEFNGQHNVLFLKSDLVYEKGCQTLIAYEHSRLMTERIARKLR